MVDSKAKGARTESLVKDMLSKHTGLDWQRIPSSGALDAKHGLKGDLYVPGKNNLYCVEVKGYADDYITSGLLTHKTPEITNWWMQTLRQAQQVDKAPLLIFKHDRSKLFVANLTLDPMLNDRWLYYHSADYKFYICLLETWLTICKPKFIT